MDPLATDSFAAYWTFPEVKVNLILFLNILGGLILGMTVGYERTFHGRAAGMRTYGLVCMASAALVVIVGYPQYWYGGMEVKMAGGDPTRVMQGIVTGIGFLGAGVIMKEGLSISGLTTAASLWASSAIGILVGVGFYATAILLTGLSAACMWWVSKLEKRLPSHPAIAITLQFRKDFHPHEHVLRHVAKQRGYHVVMNSLGIRTVEGAQEWRFIAVATNSRKAMPISELAAELSEFHGVDSYQLAHARN